MSNDDGQRTDDEAHDEQLRQGERSDQIGHGQAADGYRAQDVGDDHQPAASMYAVQPHAGRKREQQVRQEAGRGQKAHLLGVCIEDEDSDDRDRQERDLVAQDGDRLA